MIKTDQNSYKGRSLFATIILSGILVVSSLFFALFIERNFEEQCYLALAEKTEYGIGVFEANLRRDRTQLRMVARAVSEALAEGEQIHSLQTAQYLAIYDANSNLSEAGVLFPDGSILLVSGEYLDGSPYFQFEELAAKGEHIDGNSPQISRNGVVSQATVIRSFVPVRQKGKTVAFIFSTIPAKDALEAWMPQGYTEERSVNIVNRDTGDFIISTMPGNYQNFSEIQSLSVTEHESNRTLAEDVASGASGFEIMTDHLIEKKIYMCYMPMDIENWEMTVTQTANEVFASVLPIRSSLYVFLGIECLSLIVYFIYLLRLTDTSIEGVERQANMDALTGLQNRNRYESFCENLSNGTDGLACIYVDVNGLHELNNTKGHLAGDNMLKYVAGTLREEYGVDNTYRIGGDEFVAFRYDRDERSIRKDMVKVDQKIREQGYHVAVGMAIVSPLMPLAAAIKAAEMEMYQNKEAYYRSIGGKMRK